MDIPASISEDHGIAALSDNDINVYSVGVSTGGVAEIRMASVNPARRIVATTIDEEGLEFTRKHISEKGFAKQIETRNEDVSKPLAYKDASFDYVYARLVLHYLPEQGLINALSELHRVLRPGGKLFIVVRSTDSPAASLSGNTFNPITHFTKYAYDRSDGRKGYQHRFFHSEESIGKYVRDAGFDIKYIKAFEEQLFTDFMRTIEAPYPDNVIELLAVRSKHEHV